MNTSDKTTIIDPIAPGNCFHLPALAGGVRPALGRRLGKAAALCVCILTVSATAPAETLFGPGTIDIPTNQAIVIATATANEMDTSMDFSLDGVPMAFETEMNGWNPRYFIAGPHSLTLTNHCFMTFQRLAGSAVKTLVCLYPSTNSIHVPAGKTLQFLARSQCLNGGFSAVAVATNSPDPYPLYYTSNPKYESSGHTLPALSGPCDIYLTLDTTGYGSSLFVSYYFTDEVLQLPPPGFLPAVAPTLEVNIEKTYDLTNWTPTAAFHTEAEAGAFYRLRMLK